MGTNYYVDWRLSEGHTSSPWAIDVQPVTMRLHACKSLTMWQGAVFVSWVAWRHFLLTNRWSVDVVDEYDVKHNLDQFIKDVEATNYVSRSRQYNWLLEHRQLPNGQITDWLDLDGFSFHNGEFS